MIKLNAAGYQGAGSVHSRGLASLARHLRTLRPGTFDVAIENDITALGRPARELPAMVERGELQLCYIASGYLTARVPGLAVIDLPYVVSDRARAYAALGSSAGKMLADRVANATGLRVLGFWDNGFRHVSNRVRPIRSLGDCRALVIRTLDNRIYQETLAAFGFVPRVTDVRDLVRMVATGEIDAQENPLTNVINFKIYQHHPFVSMTGHLFGAALLLCTAAWFDSLPKAAAQALIDASVAATADQQGFATEEDVTALAEMRGLGVHVLQSHDIDLAGFKHAVEDMTVREATRIEPELIKAYLAAAA